MREKFNEYLKKLSRTPFDAIAAPTVSLITEAGYFILVSVIIGICVLAVKKLVKMSKEKKEQKNEEK